MTLLARIPGTCSRLLKLMVVLLAICGSLHAASTLRGDVVIMKNGDRFTGEVKRLQTGILYIETDYSSSNLAVDWSQVAKVKSTATYLITLADGKHVTGKLERLTEADNHVDDVTIVGPTADLHIPPAQVVEMSTQKSSFWRQLTGSIDAGTSFTSGNNQIAVNTDMNATYATPKWTATGDLGTSFGNQSGGTKTNRNDASLEGQYFMGRNAYLGGLLDFLHSSQQDLDLRTTVGGGYGRYLKRTGTSQFRWLGGIVYTREAYTSMHQAGGSNAEGLLGLAYDSYRFKVGEIHLAAMTFPGLSDSGRIRATTNNSLVIRLTNNFHLTFTFWDNYDSRPPVAAKNNELGLSSAIGWAF
jgi:putative salt-induced outer membrane protein YdiY